MLGPFKEELNRAYNRSMQRMANFLFRGILKTPPLVSSPNAETIFYCALGKSSSRQYIAMAKSFLRYTQNVDVIVQDDGSLRHRDVVEIKEHIKGIQIFSKEEMLNIIQERASNELIKLLPTAEEYHKYTSVKIMYLKFLNVVFRFNGRKVIIVDSDILFIRCPKEIIDWIERPYSYDFYGEGSNALAKDFYRMGFKFESLDIANFSSGTIGVGGAVSQEELLEIFSRINEYDSSLFYKWEIEQALWSAIMAERKNPLNLDTLRRIYIGSAWRPCKVLVDEAIIAHFAGAARFNRLCYIRLFLRVLRELQRLA